ncbi:hypothetical protein [uncultured Fibrobacter sp.]|uniref:hypothetical protein n=1 Tax=uncultured Fibrobacter sp. TaxID=261512 RepID=UPI0025E6F2CB|nr:hypothetical protein [uncultured Fibrobacter sp.]
MTPKPGEIVVDVNVNEYSLNGTVIGKTVADISNNDDLLIEPLNNELQKIRLAEREEALRTGIPRDEFSKAKIRIDENISYVTFYEFIVTTMVNGYGPVQYVIGSNFSEPHVMDVPEEMSSTFSGERVNRFTCGQAKIGLQMAELSEKTSHKRKSNDEIWDSRIKDTELLIRCAQKYLDLSLAVRFNRDAFYYQLGLNESGLIDGKKIDTYENIDDVWKIIEDIRLRPGMQDKEDRDLIVVVFENDILVKNLAPVVKKLKSFGYKVNLAILGG